MAITNHERVGKAMELLRTGLGPFVEREIATAHPDDQPCPRGVAVLGRPQSGIPPHPGMGRSRATPPDVGFLECGLQEHSGPRRAHLRVGTAHGPKQLGAPATLFDR